MAPKSTAAGTKSSSMTVRLDPKLKYGLEILARKQHRTLSSLVEYALDNALHDPKDGLNELEDIWDVYEADRLVKLALKHPLLLSYEEQKIWKLISEDVACWSVDPLKDRIALKHAEWDVIRKHWDIFVKVAKGKASENKLPGKILKELEDDLEF